MSTEATAAPVVQLFCNPASGSYSPRRIAALTSAFESLGAKVLLTHSIDEPPAIADEATHVCIAAGDGTVRHVAAAVARNGREVMLSIYPSGTVNLLAMEGGYPSKPAAFARHVLDGQGRRHHYPVAIGDAFFFACAGVGPDSLSVARHSARLKRRIGRLAYLVAFLSVLRQWPRHSIKLEANGETIACEAFYVAKGRYYAGRWSFAPDARVEHPLLHVVALTTARRRDFIRFIWALMRRRDLGCVPGVIRFSCTSLSASGEGVAFQADGDIVAALPVTLALHEAPILFR